MPNKRKRACIGKECVACGRCVKECPFSAITIYRGMYAAVDKGKCVGCGKCAKACPAGVIKIMEREAETI